MRRPVPIHPLFMAVYPILFLYGINHSHFPIKVIFLPLLLILLITLVIWICFSWIFRSVNKASLLTTLVLFIMFAHVPINELIMTFDLRCFGYLIGGDKILVVFWFILISINIFTLFKTKSHLMGWIKTLNLVTIVLVIFSIGKIGFFTLRNGYFQRPEVNTLTDDTIEVSPLYDCDIYYIILDGYGRVDILKKYYNFDNQPFIDFLKSHGFYIGTHSTSNYIQTILSLASSLNFSYLDDLRNLPTTDDRNAAIRQVQDNRLFNLLRKAGYQIITFSSGYYGTEISDSDLFLYPSEGELIHMNEFQNGLLRMTIIHTFSSKLLSKYDFFKQHRNRILYIFSRLSEIPYWKEEKNRFVFAHIVCPHPPFIFNNRGQSVQTKRPYHFQDGNDLVTGSFSATDYIEGYCEQLEFVNEQMKEVIHKIFQESKKPVIIVIQGDHGPGSGLNWENPEQSQLPERFSILNAYYFPREGIEGLYDTITPVNSFRVVLNHLFGSHLQLLEDRNYFSKWSQPCAFIDVTNDLK